MCRLARGAGTGAKGSLSAAAALFSQSENIPEVSPVASWRPRAPSQPSPPPRPPRAAGWRGRRPVGRGSRRRFSAPGRQAPGAEGCGPRTSLGQPLPAARRRLPGRCSLRSSAAPPRTRVHARLTSSQSRASSVGFMSLFDENGESAGGGRRGPAGRWRPHKMAARRVTRRVWRSSGGGRAPPPRVLRPPRAPPRPRERAARLSQASVLHL